MENTNSEDIKKCQNCGEPFFHGRSDKKFCTDACRIDYGNLVKSKKRSELATFIKGIAKVLLKNYRILKELNTKSTTVVPRKRMVELGFNFKYHTSSYITKKGDTYHFCYDQGYLNIDDEMVLLVVQQDQVAGL